MSSSTTGGGGHSSGGGGHSSGGGGHHRGAYRGRGASHSHSFTCSKRTDRNGVDSKSRLRDNVTNSRHTRTSPQDGSTGCNGLPWKKGCEHVCSQCQRHMNCSSNNGGAATSSPGILFDEARNLGLTSFESHYVVNFAPIASGVTYAESSSTNCPGSNVVTHSVRQLCSQIVPIHVQMEQLTTETSAGGNSSDLRESSSGSSLSLSAFHADYECSDSSGQENADSTRSVYGSTTTFRSNPSPLDPSVYSKPGLIEQNSDDGSPTQLTPTCLHKPVVPNGIKPSLSDSDDTKHSCGSDGSTGCNSNFSMQVNVSHKGPVVQPYRPSSSHCTSGTNLRRSNSSHTGAVARTLANSSTSSSKNLPKHVSKRGSSSGGSGGHCDVNSKEISRTSAAIAKMTAVWPPGRLPRSSPCPCCSGRIVWESYRQNSTSSSTSRTPGGASRHHVSGSRSPERIPPSSRHHGRQHHLNRRSVLREGSRGHLKMAVQSLAALKQGQGEETELRK